LHRALAHANPQSRYGGLSKANAKRGLIQKKAVFVGEK
jgi:hypothetical protein